jgi:glycosyltransferase involved in cell wall biosynthesis
MDQVHKKKILYCITKGTWGGAQKYVYDLATSLPKDLYEPVVLMGVAGLLDQKLQAQKIKTLILGNLTRDINIWNDISSFFKLIKIFRKEKPDIVHLNSSKMGFLGALAARLVGIKKIIFTGHGWAFNEDRGNLQKKSLYMLHLLTIALAHKTIAVSEQTKSQILKNNLWVSKMVVIKNGLAETNYLDKNTAKEYILKKLPADLDITNRLWLGTISELHKNKGLKYIIESLHLLDLASDNKAELPILIIIGDGEKREKLQERINRYNLEDTVFLVGRIDEAEKYLKAFDIFTLTSITEALPYVILEAGQAGLPIIASGVGGIPEIIDDMVNGILVRPKEPVEIQKAIDFLLKNPEKMSLFGQSIQKKVLTSFNKEDMVKKTIELYN